MFALMFHYLFTDEDSTPASLQLPNSYCVASLHVGTTVQRYMYNTCTGTCTARKTLYTAERGRNTVRNTPT